MYWLLCVLARGFSCISRPQALSLGSWFAGFLYAIFRLTPYRDLFQQTLGGAFPQWSARKIRRVSRLHVRYFVWAFIDFLRFWRLQSQGQIPREIHPEDQHHYQAAYAKGQGVILVSAHYGCWEWIPALSALQGHPTTVLVQKPSTPAFERLFCTFRAFAGVRTVNNDSYKGLGQVLKALRRGEVVGLVIDQHGESEQLWGEFFGHRVALPAGVAALAKKTGAPVVPVMIRWWGNQHQVRYFSPRYCASHEDEAAFTQGLYDLMEAEIRRYPANWLWSYNRWDKVKSP